MLFICDIDGTVADLTHRLGFIRGEGKKNWKAFHDNVDGDSPIHQVIEVIKALKAAGHDIIFVSGRMGYDNVVCKTKAWLDMNGIEYNAIFFRKAGDYRPDDVVKKEILDHIRENIGEPFAVFDDRPRVVRMWRNEGLFVFNVYQGEEEF